VGFELADVTVKKGVATALVFTRKRDKTCATELVLHVTKSETIKQDLPLNTAVEIATTFPEAGKLDYTCGMNMVTGIVTVQ
jgi:plastocyanin domain-containing protein